MGRALLILESQKDKELAAYWIGKAPAGTRVEFKASKRTLPQNDLMWALLTEVAQQLNHGGQKYTPEQWKGIFLHAFGREVNFLPSLDLKTFLPIELSSSDLSKDEMTNFIEFIIKEGTDRGVVFHTPRASNTGDRPSTPVDDETQSPPEVSSSEPSDIANASGGSPNSNAADDAPASAHEGSATPPTSPVQAEPSNLFEPTFNIPAGELQHLKDFARKSLDDAASKNDPPAKEASIERMRLNYLDAVESEDARQAIIAMGFAFDAVIKGKRTRAQAASYIAADLLGCAVVELGGRR